MGLSPAVLGVPAALASATAPLATIRDVAPQVNIPPFGMCASPSNPAVAAATAAASGVLTPQPCTPLPAGAWAPGSTTTSVNGVPCLLTTSKCACSLGGVISVAVPGQVLADAL
jgi:hypothetical protein